MNDFCSDEVPQGIGLNPALTAYQTHRSHPMPGQSRIVQQSCVDTSVWEINHWGTLHKAVKWRIPRNTKQSTNWGEGGWESGKQGAVRRMGRWIFCRWVVLNWMITLPVKKDRKVLYPNPLYQIPYLFTAICKRRDMVTLLMHRWRSWLPKVLALKHDLQTPSHQKWRLYILGGGNFQHINWWGLDECHELL